MGQISVIVPIYKVEPYLCRCIDSILAQTFEDFDVILVDDGSPDGCPAICDEYAKIDPRVHVIHQQNGGLSAARNSGIEWAFANSDSEWITFIDSDDWVHVMYLEALYRAAAENNTDISACRYAETHGEYPEPDTSDITAVTWKTEDFFSDDMPTAIVVWGKLFRKSDFDGIRFPVGKIAEDLATTYKILFRYDSICVVEQPLYIYFLSPNSLMRAEWTPRFLGEVSIWDELIDFLAQLNKNKARLQAIRGLLRNMRSNIEKMRDFGARYKTECREHTKQYLRSLRKYRKDLTPKEREKAYAFVYPRMKPLFAFRRFVSENGFLPALKHSFAYILKKEE